MVAALPACPWCERRHSAGVECATYACARCEQERGPVGGLDADGRPVCPDCATEDERDALRRDTLALRTALGMEDWA